MCRKTNNSQKYDKQIVIFIDDDAGLWPTKNALRDKGKYKYTTAIVDVGYKDHYKNNKIEIDKKLKKELGCLTDNSRIYILGHGDWQKQKAGDWTADELADLLISCGMKKVCCISLISCSAARDYYSMNDDNVSCSMNSFASHFHEKLYKKSEGKIMVDLYARNHNVVYHKDTYKLMPGKEKYAKKEIVKTWFQKEKQFVHKMEKTKIRFYWKKDTKSGAYFQHREWAYSGKEISPSSNLQSAWHFFDWLWNVV